MEELSRERARLDEVIYENSQWGYISFSRALPYTAVQTVLVAAAAVGSHPGITASGSICAEMCDVPFCVPDIRCRYRLPGPA